MPMIVHMVQFMVQSVKLGFRTKKGMQKLIEKFLC